MKLQSAEIESYRAIEKLTLPLDLSLTVLSRCSGTDFMETDDVRVGESFVHVGVSSTDRLNWTCERFGGTEPEASAMSSVGLDAFKQRLAYPDGRLSRFSRPPGATSARWPSAYSTSNLGRGSDTRIRSGEGRRSQRSVYGVLAVTSGCIPRRWRISW